MNKDPAQEYKADRNATINWLRSLLFATCWDEMNPAITMVTAVKSARMLGLILLVKPLNICRD